MSEEYDLAILK